MISSRAFGDGQGDRKVGLSHAVNETAARLWTTAAIDFSGPPPHAALRDGLLLSNAGQDTRAIQLYLGHARFQSRHFPGTRGRGFLSRASVGKERDENGPNFGPFRRRGKPKRDRRFKSPPLQQRGTANQFEKRDWRWYLKYRYGGRRSISILAGILRRVILVTRSSSAMARRSIAAAEFPNADFVQVMRQYSLSRDACRLAI
jgi:hypothetical protein